MRKYIFINNTTCYTDTTEFSIKREINRYLRHQQTWYKPKRACRQFLSCIKNRYRAVCFPQKWWTHSIQKLSVLSKHYLVCRLLSTYCNSWGGWCILLLWFKECGQMGCMMQNKNSHCDYSKVIQMTQFHVSWFDNICEPVTSTSHGTEV